MCGLIGMVAITTNDGERIIKKSMSGLEHALSISNSDRGGDAWGVMFGTGEKTLTYKQPHLRETTVPPVRKYRPTVAIVIPENNVGKDIMSPDVSWVCGHTRFATHGDASDNSNNHPHCGGGWAVMHNGVVMNRHSAQKTECDSEAILKMLISNMPSRSRRGSKVTINNAREAIAKTWKNISGSARLLITNAKLPGVIWAISDAYDPLHMSLLLRDRNLLAIGVGSTSEHAELALDTYVASDNTFVVSAICEPNALYEITALKSMDIVMRNIVKVNQSPMNGALNWRSYVDKDILDMEDMEDMEGMEGMEDYADCEDRYWTHKDLEDNKDEENI